jgi:hypothetical protein
MKVEEYNIKIELQDKGRIGVDWTYLHVSKG